MNENVHNMARAIMSEMFADVSMSASERAKYAARALSIAEQYEMIISTAKIGTARRVMAIRIRPSLN